MRLFAARVLMLLLTTRTLLRFVPLARTQKLLSRVTFGDSPDRIERAIAGINRRISFTCLENALVQQSMLQASGVECELKIGARRSNGRPEFHAWVETWSQPEPNSSYSSLLPPDNGRARRSIAND